MPKQRSIEHYLENPHPELERIVDAHTELETQVRSARRVYEGAARTPPRFIQERIWKPARILYDELVRVLR